MKTTIKELEKNIGGLSNTSKMPWFSWSISAYSCNVGSNLAKQQNTVCSGCYALSGAYRWSNTQKALNNRLKIWHVAKLNKFVNDFTLLLSEKAKRAPKEKLFFRWFDSGDLQSLEMLEAINLIALNLPEIKFWLPTKEYGIIRQWDESKQAENLIIRVSHPMLNKSFHPNKYSHNSSVYNKEDSNGFICPSSKQNNTCSNCRACWDKSIKEITYIYH